jgi:hypothetical protein
VQHTVAAPQTQSTWSRSHLIAGVWHVIAGFAAVVHDNAYLATPQYTYSFDLTAWGWIHSCWASWRSSPASQC